MTIAQNIEYKFCNNAASAMICAGSQCSDVDQDWENEATIFTFADGSQLIVNNDDVRVTA